MSGTNSASFVSGSASGHASGHPKTSRVISRPYLGRSTAEGLLFDMNRDARSSFRLLRNLLSRWMAIVAVLLISGPARTSAAAMDSKIAADTAILNPVSNSAVSALVTGPSSLSSLEGRARPRRFVASFEEWFKFQTELSVTKLLANISPADAKKGAVIASPSRSEPDYYFHWIRDAALVMDLVVAKYATTPAGPLRATYLQTLRDYVTFSRANQQAPAITGLGEPKFYVDGRPYAGPWGRPQNDGPALRALALTRFARLLLREGDASYVRTNLYTSTMPARSLIKIDLEFVANRWREASFDLWEEVKGDHFYTRLVQLAALREGAELAQLMGDEGAAAFYRLQAAQIAVTLQSHWDQRANYIRITLNRVDGMDSKQSGLDSAVILGVLHAVPAAGEWSVSDARVLATAEKLESEFQKIYSINNPDRFRDVGVAIGRYPEDVYSGNPKVWVGNPWVLTTAALAELNYKLAKHLSRGQDDFKLTSVNASFVRSVLGSRVMGRSVMPGMLIRSKSPEMTSFVAALVAKGDLFMKRVRLHSNPDGSLSEQIDRNSGYMVSAIDLTWNYAAILTAADARD